MKPEEIWAPDITYHNGRYFLYYAGSTFGSNVSVIGLATNTTLDPDAPTMGGLIKAWLSGRISA